MVIVARLLTFFFVLTTSHRRTAVMVIDENHPLTDANKVQNQKSMAFSKTTATYFQWNLYY